VDESYYHTLEENVNAVPNAAQTEVERSIHYQGIRHSEQVKKTQNLVPRYEEVTGAVRAGTSNAISADS
jgi:hypothetical protein